MRALTLLGLLLAGAALAAPEKKSTGMPTKRPPDPEVGMRLYNQSCWQCHGMGGKGDGPAAASVLGGVPSIEAVVKALPEGKDDRGWDPLVDVIQEGRGRMPAYAADIDKHDSKRILVYLKGVVEGKAPPKPEGEKADEAEAGAEAGGQ